MQPSSAVSHLTVGATTHYAVSVRNLNDRRRIELELPEFLLVALQRFLDDANRDVQDGEDDMDLTEFMTSHFVDMLDTTEVELLDREFPGFYDAFLCHLTGIRV
jgi:hypothetical protein